MTDDERWNQIHRERVRLQTQLDRLDERVARLERHDRQLAYQRQLPALLDHITERLVRLENGGRLPGVDDAPTPPSAPALDEAAKWEQLVQWHTHQYDEGTLRRIIADACRLGLAAPADEQDEWKRLANERQDTIKALSAQLAATADRAVCEVTDLLVDECLDAMSIASESAIRTVLSIAAAHWRGAEAGEEWQDG